jgi:cytosine/adenosine deaminase-related metal-dependent hydrolase
LHFVEQSRKNHGFDSKISAMFGLHASLTLSDETLDKCRQAAPSDIGFHIHAAEHPVDEYDSMKKSGMRAIKRLENHGILSAKTIVAHAVHVDIEEMEILKSSKAWVTHQPRSNMNNAVGMSQIESMMDYGIRVGLGNDGFSNAMWDEWRTAYLAHKLWNLDPRRMGADRIVRMAVDNNSELISTLFDGIKVGRVEAGAVADLIVVDYQPFTEMNAGNLPWHIVFGFRDGMVETTIVNGKVLMENRELKTMDEEKIMHDARISSREVWNRYKAQF